MTRRRAYNPLLKSYPDSERVNAVSMPAETLYTRLIAASDDAGRYWGDAQMVLARLFTQRMIAKQLDALEVESMIEELDGVRLIRRYKVREMRYIQLIDVHKVTRRDVRRVVVHPDPPGQKASGEAGAHQGEQDGGSGGGEPGAGGSATCDRRGAGGGSPGCTGGSVEGSESESDAMGGPGSDGGGAATGSATVDPGAKGGPPPRRRPGAAPTHEIAPDGPESGGGTIRAESVTDPLRPRNAHVTKARAKLQATSYKLQASSYKLQALPTGHIKIGWTADRGFQGITSEQGAAWTEAYPALVIDQELMHMGTWLRANPRRAKKRNWSRFIVGWLKKEQRDGEAQKQAGGKGRAPGRGKDRGARSEGIIPRPLRPQG